MKIARNRRRHFKAQGPQSLGFRGFTLLEVMLVVGVLAIIAGVSWPMLERLYGNQQLKQSAADVQKQLSSNRLRAIDKGIVYQFRYEVGARRYFAIPYELADAGATADGSAEFERISKELPEGLRFEATSDGLTGEKVAEALLAGLADAHDLSEATWSPAILFFADGAGTEATFRILDADDRYIEFSVRELTGAAKQSPIDRKERR